jgi:hypothetical protein
MSEDKIFDKFTHNDDSHHDEKRPHKVLERCPRIALIDRSKGY